MKIIFFGSSTDSLLVLTTLPDVIKVVTQPPKPVGRKKIITPTPIEIWAASRHIPVSYESPGEDADLLVSASYGEKIPIERIRSTTFGGLNVHPSLLPRWRGADPVPWTILSGDKTCGVTIITLSEKFDHGDIVAQKEIPLSDTDTTPALRAKLFRIGADLLESVIQKKVFSGIPQQKKDEPYARRLTRDDGFEPWEHIINPEEAVRINRKFRAFHPWPGLWTLFEEKRLKILDFTDSPITLQFEGKKPVPFSQFRTAYLPS